jgi:hypothetical protein
LIFFAQLALNVAWSAIFFGSRLPGVAFAEILLLWFAIAFNILGLLCVASGVGAAARPLPLMGELRSLSQLRYLAAEPRVSDLTGSSCSVRCPHLR